jgi:hypothetical protein
MDENKEVVNLMFIISLVGLIIKLAFENNQPAEASIWGYGISGLGVLMLMVVMLANKSSIKDISPINIFTSAIPSFITLLVFIWLIIINSSYTTIIDAGTYSQGYTLFSILATVSLIGQLMLIYMITTSTDEAANKYRSFMYLTSLFSIIFAGLMNVTLYFFTTDG